MAEIELKSHSFRKKREDSWKALEKLLYQIEKRGMKSLDHKEITDLPVLYRSTLSSLSVARSTSLDQNLVAYLESLCARAYYIIYGSQTRLSKRISAFFRYDWPEAAKTMWRETVASGLIMLLGAIVGYVLVMNNADWFYSFVPGSLMDDRTPMASTDTLRDTLYDGEFSENLMTFATFLFGHNSRVAIFAFALGFAFCIPTAFLILYNGCVLGAFFALFAGRGLGFELGGWLIIHGATEIFAIVLAGAAGFHIGKAMAFPGRRSRRDAAAEAGRQAGTLMAGVIIMLFIAGLLEGFARQLITHDILRYVIGITTFALWCIYFYRPRAPRPEAEF